MLFYKITFILTIFIFISYKLKYIYCNKINIFYKNIIINFITFYINKIKY